VELDVDPEAADSDRDEEKDRRPREAAPEQFDGRQSGSLEDLHHDADEGLRAA